MEGAGGDEQDVVRLHHAVLGRHVGPLDDRQQVALHPLARDVGAAAPLAAGDLVDLVEEDQPPLLDALARLAGDQGAVDQLLGLLLLEDLARLGHRDLLLLLAAEEAGEHLLDVHPHLLDPLRGEHLEARVGRLVDLDLHPPVVERARAELVAELLARGGELVLVLLLVAQVGVDRPRRHQELEQAVLGARRGGLAHRLPLLLLDHGDGDLDQVAHHRLDVAADVAHLGELAGLDLEEGRLGEARQPAGDLGLADAGGADHQDVLGRDVLRQLRRQLLPAPAVAQGDGHGALRHPLPDDVLVELGDDLPRRHILDREAGLRLAGDLKGHGFSESSSTVRWSLVKMQISAAILIASRTTSCAPIVVCRSRARAAESA